MLYRFCRGLLKLIFATLFPLRTVGLDNIPATGPALLCSNHISNIDPTTVGVKVRRKVHYMAKSELFSFKPAGKFLRSLGAFPVNRGGVSKESIRTALKLLKDGHVMGIFPEGTRGSGGAAKKGAAMIALRSGAPVIPVRIIGSYRPFRRLTIVYGKPIDLTEVAASAAPDMLEQATEVIMKEIHSLSA
ncbi:1-acyl-sn-glycerol-3-phosphate acyltransferase [Paenibacillus sp. IB182496]|uniref:1-acyl-sn-glycerol-3-phosphate acyltransferase n=1 Tax=Paenibacillus sabuli TaxID=2772509 RepID=A0A927BR29_9BACL|nr:lysophospholipid acyltransferase family protein [Paenibacillus sabuli]MBD2845187.1 1-acyl-sn-glycerol-3-phosphate acyltransferase [Paenibacillus sabuli]